MLQPCGDAKMRFVDDAGKPVANYEPTVQIMVTPGENFFGVRDLNSNKLLADVDYIQNVDRVNHPTIEKSDAEGRFTVPALIPGATYRILAFRKQEIELAKEFQAKSAETVDLGDIIVERPE